MILPSKSPIVLVAARTLAPAIQVMAFYVISHGHYSPGGGFQGGVLLAASFLLLRLAFGSEVGREQISTQGATLWSAVGALGYLGVGLLAIGLGANFLDYGALPLPAPSPEMVRFWGILIIEVAVGVAVASALISIYDDLLVGEARVRAGR